MENEDDYGLEKFLGGSPHKREGAKRAMGKLKHMVLRNHPANRNLLPRLF